MIDPRRPEDLTCHDCLALPGQPCMDGPVPRFTAHSGRHREFLLAQASGGSR